MLGEKSEEVVYSFEPEKAGDAERVRGMLATVNGEMSDFEKAAAIHDAVVRATTFNEAGRGKNALVSEISMCEGYSEAIIVLLGLSGVEARMIHGEANGNPDGRHAWTIAKADGKWYHIDASWDDTGAYAPREWFLRSDSHMAKTHAWDTERSPSAPEDYPVDRGAAPENRAPDKSTVREALLSDERAFELLSKADGARFFR
jgi:transglutaminase/protease-like cytokinesis protein 3